MKRYVILAFLCFASSLLGSAVTVALLPEPVVEVEQAEWTVPDVLELRKLVLVDSEGKARMELAAHLTDSENGVAMIALYDGNGTRKMAAGIDGRGGPYLILENSELPNPDHKRIALTVGDMTATLKLGHGEIAEIELQSARPADTSENRIQLRARNSSTAAFFVDDYGRATLEVKDNTTSSLFRVPESKDLILE